MFNQAIEEKLASSNTPLTEGVKEVIMSADIGGDTKTISRLMAKCQRHDIHMERVDFLNITYCPKCGEEEEAIKEVERAERTQIDRDEERKQQIIEHIGRHATYFPFHNFDGDKKQIEAYYQLTDTHKGGGWFFYGSKGSGKTLLSKLVARKLFGFGKSIKVVTATELDYQWQKQDPSSREYFINNHKAYSLLVIDDLARNTSTSESFKNFLFALIDYRIENRFKKTIITSNLNLEQIDKLDYYETDRLRLCKQIEFRGKSYRGQS